MTNATCIHNSQGQNSILNSLNTGFGPENYLSKPPCPPSKTILHLYKETYLSEFETPEEKAKVRLNLLVPSYNDVSSIINLKLLDYATKADVDKIVAGTINLLSYYTKKEVDSKLVGLKLNLDNTPIKNSTNGVTSGGVWKHIDDTVGAIHRLVQII